MTTLRDVELTLRELRAAANGARGKRVRGRTRKELALAGVEDPRAALETLAAAGFVLRKDRLPRSGDRSYRLLYEPDPPRSGAAGRTIDHPPLPFRHVTTPEGGGGLPTKPVGGAPGGALALFDTPGQPTAAASAGPYDDVAELVA